MSKKCNHNFPFKGATLFNILLMIILLVGHIHCITRGDCFPQSQSTWCSYVII